VKATPIQRRLVRDVEQNKVGEVMDENRAGDRLFLRPVGGGVEWEVFADGVEDVDPAQPHREMS
jgi:hypothetical protein